MKEYIHCNAYLVLLIDKKKIMIYKSTYRIKRKYFIMLIGLNVLHLNI